MAEISFPLNPANNDVYTVNGRYWRWDGVSWNSIINNNYNGILFNDNGNANTILVGGNGQVLTSNGTSVYWGSTVSFSGLSNNYVPFYSSITGSLSDSIITKSSSNTNIGINTSSPEATLHVNGTVKGQLQSYSETITALGTITSNANLDTSLSNIFTLTLGANNLTLSFTNPPANNISRPVTVLVTQDSTGSRFVTFANSKYTDGTLPVLSTGADSIDILTFFTVNGGSSWYGSFAMANVA